MTYAQWLTALCVWREARGQSLEAMEAIFWVIVNRAMDARNRWPKSTPGVILQHEQFSSFSASDPNGALFPIPPPAGNAADWGAFEQAQAAVTSTTDDSTGGANHYESLPPHFVPWPSWADPKKITARIGPFRFYKL